jgi:hypothetical protein
MAVVVIIVPSHRLGPRNHMISVTSQDQFAPK